jgi:KipI family sensor histidine kinase inhibitor
MADPVPSPPSERLRILPFGDAALTVELGETIDPVVNDRVLALAGRIRSAGWLGVVDIVPTYRSLTLHLDLRITDPATMTALVRSLARSVPSAAPHRGSEVTIPVLYGGAYGPDLEALAGFARLSVPAVIREHSAVHYRVYMLGFSPGFPYLGTVPEVLAMPRLATPRPMVPAGSVGIAERQTGVYPMTSPGGWRIIGRTPLSLYRPDRDPPCLMTPGDLVRFVPIDEETFARMAREERR